VSSPGSFTRFLTRSLELLRDQAPRDYEAVRHHLGDLCVSIEVDAERLSVADHRGVLDVKWGAHRAVATARASRSTLLDLLEGKIGLTEAIVADRVALIGPLPALVNFHDALLAYFMGAVRTPQFAPLLDDFFRASQDVLQPLAPDGITEI